MASKAGIFNVQELGGSLALYPQHNPETSAAGLPVKADELCYQGVMIAYDPANSQAQVADPAMPATAKVVGVLMDPTVDNRDGAKGDKKIMPKAGVYRMKSDGNLTAAHLYKPCRVVDDHTVGVPAGTDADRFAGLFIGLDGGYAWVLIHPEVALRGPATLATITTANAADLATAQALANATKTAFNNLHAILVSAGIIAPAA
jgi:hypothetical protein